MSFSKSSNFKSLNNNNDAFEEINKPFLREFRL